MEDKNYLLEAFKAFDDLNEEIFDISINDGLEKAKEYKDEIVDEIDDSEIVIDPLAADEEEIEDTYVGKAILKCSICQSMLYKDPEEVIVDDEVELANVGEACPYCQSEDGYYVIGQVEEFCDDECEHAKDEDHDEENEESSEEVEIEEDEREELDEAKTSRRAGTNYDKVMRTLKSLGESKDTLDDIDADADDKKEVAKKKFAKAKDDADSDRDYKLKKKGLKESVSGKFSKKDFLERVRHEIQDIIEDNQDRSYDYTKNDLKNKRKIGYLISDILDDMSSEGRLYIPNGWAKDIENVTDEEAYTYFNHLIKKYDLIEEVKKIAQNIKIEESCKSKRNIKESDKPAATSIEDAQKWVDYDMKKYGKISARTNRLIKEAGFQIIKDNHGDYEVTAGKFESMKEDFERVDIETDRERMSMSSDENGKVTVTTEPKENVEVEEKEEVIEPVSDEIKAKFKTSDDEAVDYDFDEFEESDFDELGESYLRRVYENVKSFKTTKGAINGNNLKLEGLITFKSGKQVKTNFVFESYKATKTGKLKFIGENKQFAKGKKSFTLSARADGKKLCCESLTYNYRAKSPDGASKRLYGTVKR